MRSWPSADRWVNAWLAAERVVGRHAREAEVVDRRVDQHDRDAPGAQQPVVVVRGGDLGEVAAGEHHPGRVLLEQHVHVVGLGQAARGAGAEHRGEPALREARRR